PILQSTALCLFFICFYIQPTSSQPGQPCLSLPHIFSDHMVLQRGQAIKVWGWAAPDETIRVELDNKSAVGRTDEHGGWEVALPAMDAGGPYELKVHCMDSVVVLKDVLVGEVWLCSGQSNMEWPMSLANDAKQEIAAADFPQIRLFTVPKDMNTQPLGNTLPAQWERCSPAAAADFSAVGYFFGRHLHENLGVPIGLVDATWGGTAVETWTSAEALAGDPELGEVARGLEERDFEDMMKRSRAEQAAWEKAIDEQDKGLKEEWHKEGYDWGGWKTMELPQPWEDAGYEGLDGAVWFKRAFTLAAGEVAGPVKLELGPIDDSDVTYVNGVEVGRMINQYNADRSYAVPAGLLREGENTITVRVIDTGGGGGIYGEPEALKIITSRRSISLAGPWHFSIGTGELPPRPAILHPNSLPALLYNAMIHPLIPFGIRGAIWYQGESNAGDAFRYRERFRLMIRDWRKQWGQGDFPFLFVQLANFHEEQKEPAESQWAELRESQARALKEPHTGMAVAIDIGEADDIHPRNKQEVGRRLALTARAIVYGEALEYSGPVYRASKIEDNRIRLYFSHFGRQLISRHGLEWLRGFSVAGADGVFHPAQARISEDNTVLVSSEAVPAPRYVRYAWADNPGQLDLYNDAGLPAAPFRTDELKVSTQKP
ncbi:MAG: beta galactosidase jelly roll domain-containing protein, partial [Phaeodactylibacter sp.]|nr:beta galactosidase jelly roll domain-containing protein [Phaeodactylibacter sp.]